MICFCCRHGANSSFFPRPSRLCICLAHLSWRACLGGGVAHSLLGWCPSLGGASTRLTQAPAPPNQTHQLTQTRAPPKQPRPTQSDYHPSRCVPPKPTRHPRNRAPPKIAPHSSRLVSPKPARHRSSRAPARVGAGHPSNHALPKQTCLAQTRMYVTRSKCVPPKQGRQPNRCQHPTTQAFTLRIHPAQCPG